MMMMLSPLTARAAVVGVRYSCCARSSSGARSRSFSSWRRGAGGGPRLTGTQALYGVLGAGAIAHLGISGELGHDVRRLVMKYGFVSTAGIFNHLRFENLFLSTVVEPNTLHALFAGAMIYFNAQTLAPSLGAARFLALYCGSGAMACLVYAAVPLLMPSRRQFYHAPSSGIDGGVSALIGMNVAMNYQRVVMLWGILPIPMAAFAALYWGPGAWYLATDSRDMRGHQSIIGLSGGALGLALGLLLKRRVRF
jgi:membrane associated rhomboid family serine protease